MIPIKKLSEPLGLKNAKKENPSLIYGDKKKDGFSNLEEHESAFLALREQLLKEQKYLCCYCQNRITLKGGKSGEKIMMATEHFIPKNGNEADASLQLEYGNLLAACLGNKDSGAKDHCDAKKKHKRLKVLPNPATIRQQDFSKFLKYKVKKDEVIVLPTDASNKDLIKDIEILNLNEQRLKEQRFSVWAATWKKVFKNEKPNKDEINDILTQYDFNSNKSELKPFCGFIFSYYQNKKIELGF